MVDSTLRRRSVLGLPVAGLAVAGAGSALGTLVGPPPGAPAGAPAIEKPLPPTWFIDHGTNAETRWESVENHRYRTPQSRLFVRNHTRTPQIDPLSYRLRIHGDGLADPAGMSIGLADLRRRFRAVEVTSVHECTGNGRSFFDTQQGKKASGTAWTLGAVGTVTWRGARLRDVLRWAGVRPEAVSVQGVGLDDEYVDKGENHGRVRRPFPIAKALDRHVVVACPVAPGPRTAHRGPRLDPLGLHLARPARRPPRAARPGDRPARSHATRRRGLQPERLLLRRSGAPPRRRGLTAWSVSPGPVRAAAWSGRAGAWPRGDAPSTRAWASWPGAAEAGEPAAP